MGGFVTPSHEPIIQIKCNPNPKSTSFSVIHQPKMHTNVFNLKPKNSLSRHVLFDENLTHSSLSQSALSVTTQPTRESHISFPRFFDAQQAVVSPSQLSSAPTSSLSLEGPPAIIAYSLGNFGPSAPFLHDCLPTLDHNTTYSSFPLHDSQTGSLNLQSQSHDSLMINIKV